MKRIGFGETLLAIFLVTLTACENDNWEPVNGTPYEVLGQDKYEKLSQTFVFIGEYCEGTVVVKQGDKFGLLNPEGKTTLKCEYDAISRLVDDLRLLIKDKKYGFSDSKGRIISDCVYDSCLAIKGGHIPVEMNGKWGFINNKGEKEISYIYDEINEYNDSIFIAGINGKLGIADFYGNTLLDFKWTSIRYKTYRGATYAKDGKYFSIVNTKFKQVTDAIFEPWNYLVWAYDSEGYACAISSDTHKWGVVEVETGKTVVPFIYDDLGFVSDGLVRAEKDEMYGFLDMKGNTVIPFIYDDAEDFSEGLAMVGKAYARHRVVDLKFCHYGFINKKGEVVIPLTFADQSLSRGNGFHYGLAAMGKKQYGNHFAGDMGYIDKTGRFVIDPIYERADNFELGGVAIVRNKHEKYGVIDTLGNVLIPFVYDKAYIDTRDSIIKMTAKDDDVLFSIERVDVYNRKGELIR